MKVIETKITWYYVYKVPAEKVFVFDRTCGTIEAAQSRIEQLKKLGIEATYVTKPIEGAFH